jgi:phosphate uptake regulator
MSRLGSALSAEHPPRVRADPTPPRAGTLGVHELGEGRLEPTHPNERIQKVLQIDATGAPANLLERLLVGSYITGHDQVILTAKDGLTAAQRREIHRVVDRTLGMTVVGDTPAGVEVQNFVDPSKFELPRLIHRVVQMLRTELGICRTALLDKDARQLESVETMEEEIDQLYLLMVRQLLLSSDSPRIARIIDVESHHYQIGDRLVAKMLEVTGDLIHGIATELQGHLPGLRRMPPNLVHLFASRIERLEHLLARTMDAFGRLSVIDANTTLNEIGEALAHDSNLGQMIYPRVPNRRVAVAAQRIACNLVMALEMLIVVNEVTINRSVEPETVAHAGTRVRFATHGPYASPRISALPTSA